METYQGWKNYATWGVALVLDNDHETYVNVRGEVASLREQAPMHPNVAEGIWTEKEALRFGVADFVKELVEDTVDEAGRNLMASQLIHAGLAEVDWDEIANHYIEE